MDVAEAVVAGRFETDVSRCGIEDAVFQHVCVAAAGAGDGCSGVEGDVGVEDVGEVAA